MRILESFCGLKMCLDIKCFADGETGSFKNFSVEENNNNNNDDDDDDDDDDDKKMAPMKTIRDFRLQTRQRSCAMLHLSLIFTR